MKREWLIAGGCAIAAYLFYQQAGSSSDVPDPDGGDVVASFTDVVTGAVGSLMGISGNMTFTGLSLIQRNEGCRLTAYNDPPGSSKYSIGWGHSGAYKGQTCTQAQADAWRDADIAGFVASVNRMVTVPVTQAMFNQLVDFQYNTGGLAGSTLLRLLNQGDYAGAAAQFSRWIYKTVNGQKIVDPTLASRRAAEQQAFLSEGFPSLPASDVQVAQNDTAPIGDGSDSGSQDWSEGA